MIQHLTGAFPKCVQVTKRLPAVICRREPFCCRIIKDCREAKRLQRAKSGPAQAMPVRSRTHKSRISCCHFIRFVYIHKYIIGYLCIFCVLHIYMRHSIIDCECLHSVIETGCFFVPQKSRRNSSPALLTVPVPSLSDKTGSVSC